MAASATDAELRVSAGGGASLSRPRHVDLLVVSANTTAGLRRDHDELMTALDEIGIAAAGVSASYGPAGRLRVAHPLIELIEAASLRLSTARAVEALKPARIIASSSLAALLFPRRWLAASAIRFDGLAQQTRPGPRSWLPRALERRVLDIAPVLLPYTEGVATAVPPANQAKGQILTSSVRPGPAWSDERVPGALCYAADPDKKGLDLAVAAWAAAAPRDAHLHVAGIEPDSGAAFLRGRGISVPENLIWEGRMPAAQYRELSARLAIHIGASRRDEFATTQLEALSDGAVLVTVPSEGPIEPLGLARELDRRLVADSVSAPALAAALRTAFDINADEASDYRRRAAELMRPYSHEAFVESLERSVIPALERLPALA